MADLGFENDLKIIFSDFYNENIPFPMPQISWRIQKSFLFLAETKGNGMPIFYLFIFNATKFYIKMSFHCMVLSIHSQYKYISIKTFFLFKMVADSMVLCSHLFNDSS